MGQIATGVTAGMAGGLASEAVRRTDPCYQRGDLTNMFLSSVASAVGETIKVSFQEQAAIESLAESKGSDLTRPGVTDAVRDLYRHQQGSITLDPRSLRDALQIALTSTGARAEDIAATLDMYDSARFTQKRTPSVEVHMVERDASAATIAQALARDDAEHMQPDGLAETAGFTLGRGISESGRIVNMVDSTGRVLTEVGQYIEQHPVVGLALNVLDIAGGPAMYVVREGVNAIAGDAMREQAGLFNDGLAGALFASGRGEDESLNAAKGATFFAGMATGAVTSSVQGLRLVKDHDRLGSRLAGPALARLRGIEQALGDLSARLP